MPDENLFENKRLTRQGMERILAERGSVMYKGRVITRSENLPNEASLARDNPQTARAARARLDVQMRNLAEQISQIDSITKPAAASKNLVQPMTDFDMANGIMLSNATLADATTPSTPEDEDADAPARAPGGKGKGGKAKGTP